MQQKCILVIDDEKNLCAIIKACLENIGHWRVVTSQSGREGLVLAKTEHPNAILLDVIMPELDGLTVLHALQSHPATRGIPVILLTAKVQKQDLNQFAQLGIAGVIHKPFDPLKLTEQVAEKLKWSLTN